jgi:hypothetical protein
MKVKYMISWYLEESASKEKIWTVMITNPIIKENIFDVLLFPTTLVQWNKTEVRITITWSLNKIQRIIDLALKSVGLHQHQIYLKETSLFKYLSWTKKIENLQLTPTFGLKLRTYTKKTKQETSDL